MLYYNAKVYTMKSPSDKACGMLVTDNGKIAEVIYSRTEIQRLLQTGIVAVDLEGSYVYPGFVDTHTHSFEGGLYANAADLTKASTIADVLDILASAELLNNIVVAYHLDENTLKERRFPTLQELDALYPDKPCIIRRVDGHSSVVNSIAYKQSGLQAVNQNKKPFSGLLRAEDNDFMSGWFHKNIDEEGILKAYRKAASIAVAKGHTTVHTMVGDGKKDLMHYEKIADIHSREEFPVDFVLYPQVFDAGQVINLYEKIKGKTNDNYKPKLIGGCVLADGSFGSKTAALLQPYRDSQNNCGILYKNDEEWYRFIREAHNAGIQIAVHCIGDAAIKQIVRIYSKVQKENPQDLRHQIIHCELLSEESIISEMAENKIAAVMQPLFDKLWGGDGDLYAEVLGKERASQCNRLRSLTVAGVLITGGSDWYVTDIDALAGIDAAVNLHNKQERLSVYEAVQLYTVNPAKLIGREDDSGMLQKGFAADFVCLERDVMTDTDIASIPVKTVFRNGRKVFG